MKELRERFWLALHVLRGRPLMYRMHLSVTDDNQVNYIPTKSGRAFIVENVIEGNYRPDANGVILEDRL